MKLTLSLFSLLLLLSACEQLPARVEDKGKNSYKPYGVMLAQLEPSAGGTGQTEPAAFQAVESKDLVSPASFGAAMPAASSPLTMPVEGKIISRFGKDRSDGIVIAAPAGTPVRAASSGTVVFVGDQLKSYGNMVIIKHADQKNTTYAHLGRTFVHKGQKVDQGANIGTVGRSGNVSTPQLHFALREGATPKNPLAYMDTATSSL